MREIVTSGMICLDGEYDFTYCVAEIEYIERDDETYCYEITPDYSVIDLLPSTIFQGIPGLDLDLRKESYVRENMVPVFISERTPGENREDLWELLAECDMQYLNRLEWLIRTDTRYSGDGLYVKRLERKDLKVESLNELGSRGAIICRKVLEVLCAGGRIETKDFVIDDGNRKGYHELFMSLYRTERKYLDGRRREGVRKSADAGKYKGRNRIKIDTLELYDIFNAYEIGKMTGKEAAEALNISDSTFFRRYREYKGSVLNHLGKGKSS